MKQRIQQLEEENQNLTIKLRMQITRSNKLAESLSEVRATNEAYKLLLKQSGIKTGREAFEITQERLIATKYAAKAAGRSVSNNEVQSLLF